MWLHACAWSYKTRRNWEYLDLWVSTEYVRGIDMCSTSVTHEHSICCTQSRPDQWCGSTSLGFHKWFGCLFVYPDNRVVEVPDVTHLWMGCVQFSRYTMGDVVWWGDKMFFGFSDNSVWKIRLIISSALSSAKCFVCKTIIICIYVRTCDSQQFPGVL